MALVCWLHTLYLIVVHPYADRLEQGLVTLGSLLMSVMATLGLVTVFTATQGAPEDSPVFTAFAYLGLCSMLYFFFQAAALSFAAVVDSNRQYIERMWRKSDAGGDLEPNATASSPEISSNTDPSSVTLIEQPLLETPLLVVERTDALRNKPWDDYSNPLVVAAAAAKAK
jgi:hypothetical protein